MKCYPVKAFVIKGMKYGDSHMILTLFLWKGKFSRLLKGCAKAKKPDAGPFAVWELFGSVTLSRA